MEEKENNQREKGRAGEEKEQEKENGTNIQIKYDKMEEKKKEESGSERERKEQACLPAPARLLGPLVGVSLEIRWFESGWHKPQDVFQMGV